MKKLFLLLAWSCLLISSVFAQSSDTIVSEKPIIPAGFVEQLWNIGVRFCDNGMSEEKVTKDFFRLIRPGWSKEICIWFFNVSDKPINIIVWFAEGIFSWWKMFCGEKFIEKNDFLDRFRQDWVWKTISLTAKSNVVKKANFYSNSSWTGDYYWCLAYKIAENDKIATWAMFRVVVRNASPMQFTITWDAYNLQWWDDIKYDVKNNINSIMKLVIAIIIFLLAVEIVKVARKKKK